jgi:hypothetical protein
MVEIQYNLIGLINTQYCYYKRPTEVMSCCNLLMPIVFKQSKCKDVFFTSAASVHCWTITGISFLLNFPEWVQEYISWFSCEKQTDNISSGEPFLWHRISSPGCIKHEENSECMKRWTRTFPKLNITLFFVFCFQCNLFFDKQNMCQEQVARLFNRPVEYKCYWRLMKQ